MCPEDLPPSIAPDLRGGSLSIMNATKEGNELHDLEDANLIGDLDRSHNMYSTWFARQRPATARELSAKTTYTLLPIALLPMINQPPLFRKR